MEIQQKLQILEETLEVAPNSLTLDTSLSTLEEWNSMTILSVMVMLEDDYEVFVSGDELKACKTVSQLAELIP